MLNAKVFINAISHGFSTRSYKGAIRLSARMQGELFIHVEDNGTGMTDTQIVEYNEALNKCTDTGGIGMMNVNRRLRLRYGDDYGITLSRSGKGGLCVVVKLPVNT
jgi:two-component system sensor histidine kinase YesM